VGRKKKTATELLTEFELKIMKLLWQMGCGSVKDLLGAWPDTEVPAYTTVSTMMRVLAKKKIVGCEKEGRGHIYVPLISKSDYEQKSLNQIVSNVFDGAPANLIRCLVNSKSISQQDINELLQALNRQY